MKKLRFSWNHNIMHVYLIAIFKFADVNKNVLRELQYWLKTLFKFLFKFHKTSFVINLMSPSQK